MFRKSMAVLVLMLAGFGQAVADLSGVWNGNDGGTYYLNQVGERLFWYGESGARNPNWSNVFVGRVNADRVRGEWADVPKGRARNEGRLVLRVEAGGAVLVAIDKSGGFGGSRWVRAGHGGGGPLPPGGVVREDCVNFDPDRAEVRLVNGSWKIVDGSHWLWDFGPREVEARKSLRVVKHYRADQSCFVGRPDPSLEYLLVSGRPPQGPMAGEDCVGFNPNRVTVANIGGRWKLVDGNHMMFDFVGKRPEAEQALRIIQKHRFDQSCFVGRPGPTFQYLRR
jgi:hypothetical protein